MQSRYGLDELGKVLLVAGAIFYFIGIFVRSEILSTLGMMGLLLEFFRMMSSQGWDRSEENKKYLKYRKLWKLRWENRKEYRFYLCKRCGKYIRVPKGKGKIQVTCPGCGDKKIRRT